MRTWETLLVRYEEQPYREGLNKLAVYYLADNSFLGDVIPDNADHLQDFINAIENNVCPVMEGWDVGNGKRADLSGWTDKHMITDLMAAFAGTTIMMDAKVLSLLAYEESQKAHKLSSPDEDYPLTFEGFLLARLEQSGKIKGADAFEDVQAANKAGYYWLDRYNKWLRYITE